MKKTIVKTMLIATMLASCGKESSKPKWVVQPPKDTTPVVVIPPYIPPNYTVDTPTKYDVLYKVCHSGIIVSSFTACQYYHTSNGGTVPVPFGTSWHIQTPCGQFDTLILYQSTYQVPCTKGGPNTGTDYYQGWCWVTNGPGIDEHWNVGDTVHW